ncbi:MAG: hypothetical protein M3063_02375 [Actinomycetota bacterium]|nr:hypothetical protein [Actinomycetota bacterium]MDQ6945851.1 hypothetical protein [Actinomycetota bacterium]
MPAARRVVVVLMQASSTKPAATGSELPAGGEVIARHQDQERKHGAT